MRILVLEDTIAHQVRIETTLAEISQELGIDIQAKITGKIKEFKEYIEQDDINQLYFLDIDIKGEETKGLEVAQFIRHHNPYAIIVFVTSKSEFATMTFKYKVSALDFIDKDINDEAFKTRIKETILYTKSTLIENTNMVDYFDYSYRGNDVRMPYNDIFYIETSGSSHKLRIVGKNFIKEFYGTITDIQEKDRESQRFFSPHKSYLVNIGNIVDYDKKNREIIFYENHRCPITRMKVKYLKEILKKKDKK
ncbi:competence system response regulator transcription factor ComE, partial [Streptococcus sp. DD11]|uniref:competence system response regulator transcription factor ComE n=1 Tax=Streptococcus sp. DD11 TaxID=1777879 RepID=UPI0013E35A78